MWAVSCDFAVDDVGVLHVITIPDRCRIECRASHHFWQGEQRCEQCSAPLHCNDAHFNDSARPPLYPLPCPADGHYPKSAMLLPAFCPPFDVWGTTQVLRLSNIDMSTATIVDPSSTSSSCPSAPGHDFVPGNKWGSYTTSASLVQAPAASLSSASAAKSQQPFEMELFSCKPSREGGKAAWTAYMLTTNDKFDAMDGATPVPSILCFDSFFVAAQILSIKQRPRRRLNARMSVIAGRSIEPSHRTLVNFGAPSRL